VALFERRARAVDPRLALEPGDDEHIERICARLDGLPLAIELAAARIKVLSPAEILHRLSRRLDLLSSGPRDAPVRQQTLRAAMAWSYDLLEPEARRLFAQLGVFVGGYTLEAAEAVCGPQALDGIAALADQSLVTRGRRRFGMLETVREYALEQLEASGEAAAVRDRHARAYVELLSGAEEGMVGSELPRWLERLDADYENIRAGITHAIAAGDAATATALVAPLWRYWVMRGTLSEGRTLTGAVLELTGAPPELRMRAANGAGILAGEQGDLAAAHERFEESGDLAREVGSLEGESRSSSNLGILAFYAGDCETAIRRYEEAAAIARETGNDATLSVMLQNTGIAHDFSGERERAVPLLEESLAVARRTGALALITSIERTLARVLLDEDRERAFALLRQSLASAHQLADAGLLVDCLETAAGAVAGSGDPHTGALLWGAAGATRHETGAARPPDDVAFAERVEAALHSALTPEAFAAGVAAGAALPLDEAVERALAI
jgi:predicted ATPase